MQVSLSLSVERDTLRSNSGKAGDTRQTQETELKPQRLELNPKRESRAH